MSCQLIYKLLVGIRWILCQSGFYRWMFHGNECHPSLVPYDALYAEVDPFLGYLFHRQP